MLENPSIVLVENFLRQSSIIHACCYVGSFAADSPTYRDIDIFCLVNLSQQEALNVLFKELEFRGLNRLRINDDAVQGDCEGISVSIAVREQGWFENFISSIKSGLSLNGTHVNWAPGYWVPEAFISDICICKPIKNFKPFLDVKEYFSEYPRGLQESILSFCIEEIKQKTDKIDSVEEGLRYVLRSDILLAELRAACARHKYYLTGFSKILRGDLSEFPPSLKSEIVSIINRFQVHS